VSHRDPTLKAALKAEVPAIIARVVRAYLGAVDRHAGQEFWNWCPDALRSAQLEVAKATNCVQQFIHLKDEDNDKQVSRLERKEGQSVALKAVQTAFGRFMQAYHSGAKKADKMDKGALTRLGFEVSEDNVCHSCFHSGGTGCCERYDRSKRKKVLAVRDARLIGDESDAGPSF
jgi:hypothetical protein